VQRRTRNLCAVGHECRYKPPFLLLAVDPRVRLGDWLW
jgi:hypothetical protein